MVVLLGGAATAAAVLAMPVPTPAGALGDPAGRTSSGPGQPQLRVLLLEAPSLDATAVGASLELRDSQGRLLTVLPAGERLRISRQGWQLRLERPDAEIGQAPPLALPLQELWIGPPGPARPNATPPSLPWRFVDAGPSRYLPLVGLGRHRYRGQVQIRPEADRLQVVNHLALETYLTSVVGSEMPARWPAAALQAQAVAARTYALAQLKPGASYDLKATVASQAYLGVEAETDSTQSAVGATRALVLSHGGALIDAVFHSSSGGSTENSGELWNRQLPYLVSVPDADTLSPWHQWSVRFEPEQLLRAFRETDGASRIEVLAASSTGRVRRARVIGPGGSLELSGSELRQRLGLRSTLVQFRFEPPLTPGPAGGITTATARANAEAAALNRYGLRSDAGESRSGGHGSPGGSGAAAGSSSGVVSAGGPPPPPPPPPPPGGDVRDGRSAPSAAEPTITAQLRQEPLAAPLPTLEVVGRGFGHGVGMSQWGAYGLALQGVSYVQILRHYYRGAQLVAYPSR
jgi:stage II sporulation protein D